MTSVSLTRNRDYLAANRRMILGRALAAGMAGALPIPVIEDWLAAAIRRSMVRRIAESRQVDLDDDAIRAVADGSESVPEWAEIAAGRVLFRFITRPWRRLLIAAFATRRVRAASRAYVFGTLFDHYCARLHVGGALDKPQAKRLRALMEQAVSETGGGLSRTLFQRALLATARNTVRVPFELLNWATGGSIRRLLKRRREIEAVTEVDVALEQQLSSHRSFLARATAAAELELAAETNPYLGQVLDKFERQWRENQD